MAIEKNVIFPQTHLTLIRFLSFSPVVLFTYFGHGRDIVGETVTKPISFPPVHTARLHFQGNLKLSVIIRPSQ